LRRFGVESTVRPSLALYNTCEDVDALWWRRYCAFRPNEAIDNSRHSIPPAQLTVRLIAVSRLAARVILALRTSFLLLTSPKAYL